MIKKIKIDVEDVIAWGEEGARYNKHPLSEIEFFRDGKRVEIPESAIDSWRFMGMNNTDFILNRDWPTEDDISYGES
jgi:hypothetical protein